MQNKQQKSEQNDKRREKEVKNLGYLQNTIPEEKNKNEKKSCS